VEAVIGRAAGPGSTIAVVTPGSPPETRAEVQRGVAWWESKGYRVKLMPGALEEDGWHAGSPEVRARDLQAAFADPEIDAIQTMRGGYGSAQVIPLLDFDAIAETPKAFVGVSDITALHAALLCSRRIGDVLRAEPDDGRQPIAFAVHRQSVLAGACRRDDWPGAGGPRPSDG
jgi:muramoyltetrapeptide carboxypeptidase LdcA involved in peptidoglycan recycling